MSKKQTSKSEPGFHEITHTADLAIEVRGNSLSDLFGQALWGMNFLILKKTVPGSSLKNEFYLRECTPEDLLVSFLSECNFRIQSRREYIGKIRRLDIEPINDYYELKFEGEFSLLNQRSQHELIEIKSVTYHQMKIVFENNLYKTKIIFDI